MNVGVIATTGKGLGFITVGENRRDVYVPQGELNTALNGDTVEYQVVTGRDGRPEGRVVRVLSRKAMTFAGTLARDPASPGQSYILTPDDSKLYTAFRVRVHDELADLSGHKVLVRITEWTNPVLLPQAELVTVFGKAGDHEAEIGAIVANAGFDPTFPEHISAEAERIRKQYNTIPESEIALRRDFRKTLTFTIDPVNAKDFDDALSFVDLGNGTYEVGVHIADVSHFVRPGTKLDDEALRRATSVYLVDRTIPMLPEALSNDICSLNPHVDRLTFSAVFTIDSEANILDEWFGRTVIHSDHRFSYESAQEVLNSPDASDPVYARPLTVLNTLAKELRARRMRHGAISFENDREVYFELDSSGKPIAIHKKVRTDSHKLIEEFMLLANRKVAEHVAQLEKSREKKHGDPVVFVYRNHDIPDIDAVMNLKEFLQSVGLTLAVKGKKLRAEELNRVIEQAEHDPAMGALIEKTILRSMAKAVYSTKNIGHYGLAFKHYTHFTSPIRRYPDTMVHRLLAQYLSGKYPKPEELKQYEEKCLHSSRREREAMHAEWDSIKFKQAEFLSSRIGTEYTAVITGVTDWGMYVETMEDLCEGLVSLRDMTDDYYETNPKTYSLVGQKTKKKYRVGEKVKVRVKATDVAKKQVNFELVD